MNLIFSADRQWGIGRDGDLLFRASGDMANFKRLTKGRTVVMGRKTLESLPGGRPLADRENIVLTRDPAFAVQGAVICHDMQELEQALRGRDLDDIFVIGGAQVYELLLPYCRRAYVTRWECEGRADAHVRNLDSDGEWLLLEQSDPRTEEDLTYRFCVYIRIKQDGDAV